MHSAARPVEQRRRGPSCCRRRSPSVTTPDEPARLVHHRRHAEALDAHLLDGLLHGRAAPRRRAARSPVCMRSRDPEERLPAEAAAAGGAPRSPRAAGRAGRAAPSRGRRPWPARPSCSRSGARFIGQASSATPTSRTTSACRASVEPGVPGEEDRAGSPSRLIAGSTASTSSVSPEFDSASTTSSRASMPDVAVHALGGMEEVGGRARCSRASPRSCAR